MTIRMNELQHGQSGRVQTLHAEGGVRRRMLDLGLIPGTAIQRLMASPAGDPVCYRVRGAMIALRSADAGQIAVHV
jgi:ferrous iron transport protein A